jgi:hypothetical protein
MFCVGGDFIGNPNRATISIILQGDRIGRIFAKVAIFYWDNFFENYTNSPN